MNTFRTLDDIDLAGKRVLVRVDINVPVKNGLITDDTRIRAVAPTVTEILKKGGKPILLAHRGRPNGRPNPELSLGLLRLPLSEAFNAPVTFAETGAHRSARDWVDAMEPGDVLLLENMRFHPGEETNAPTFAQALANLASVYVDDAFSVSHRAHASTVGVARILPAVAGRQMEAELTALQKALSNPERPVIAVVGGAKISTKLDLIGNLMRKVDQIVIGGGMANTFLAAQGHNVGRSLCEHDLRDTARDIMRKAASANCKIILPSDVVVAEEFAADATHRTVAADACPDEAMILDAGARTVDDIIRRFQAARTIVWNGPLGAFEILPFDAATNAAATAAAELAASGRVLAVAGGGDTVAALNASGSAKKFTHVSTAGGAFLEWLEGKTLPGIAALQSNEEEFA